jgi:hypothetical protein
VKLRAEVEAFFIFFGKIQNLANYFSSLRKFRRELERFYTSSRKLRIKV